MSKLLVYTDMMETSFIVNHRKIAARLFSPGKKAEKHPAVLFIHGWMSNQEGYAVRADALNKLGYLCLTFDLGGHGKSGGKLGEFSRADHFEQVISAYDFLREQTGVDSENISVVGSSYGGYLASLLIGERPIKSAVLRVPALYADNDFDVSQSKIINRLETRDTRKMKLDPKENRALLSISQFTEKVLIIESENDDLIPHEVIENFKNAVSNPHKLTYILMKGADHSLQTKKLKQEFISILEEWFQEVTA